MASNLPPDSGIQEQGRNDNNDNLNDDNDNGNSSFTVNHYYRSGDNNNGNNNGNNRNAYLNKEHPPVFASEGSITTLDGNKIASILSFSPQVKVSSYRWDILLDRESATDGISFPNIFGNQNSRFLSFKAPYIDDNNIISKTIRIQLSVRDHRSNLSFITIPVIIKRTQRVIVLQGGGALGAYQAGVFKALYEKLYDEDKRKGRQNRPLFDVVAGTSIGAINASVLVSYALWQWKKQTDNGQNMQDFNGAKIWQDADKWIYQFWDDISSHSPIDFLLANPIFKMLWDAAWINAGLSRIFWKNITEFMVKNSGIEKKRTQDPWNYFYYFWPDNFGPVATPETARQYYSNYIFTLFGGTPNVLSPGIPQPDMKFFDQSKFWMRFDNTKFTDTLKLKPDNENGQKYWDDSKVENYIKTDYKYCQPRLIFVAVDVQDSRSVCFDSYSDKSQYGPENHRRTVRYPDGLEINHLKTSITSFPSYIYPELDVYIKQLDGSEILSSRTFWDGVFLSNTPMREVIQSHRDYWHKVKNMNVPDLEVYIIGLYPTLDDEVPVDRDAVENREYDILFNDKTEYDEKVAKITGDYIDLAMQLKELAIEKGASREEIDAILEQLTGSRSRDGERRRFEELIEGRFRLTRVVRIENSGGLKSSNSDNNDQSENEIFGKAFDFTKKTVSKMRQKGYDDAVERMDVEFIIEGFERLIAFVEARPEMKLATKALTGPQMAKSERFSQGLLEKLQELDGHLQKILFSLQEGNREEAKMKIGELKNQVEELGNSTKLHEIYSFGYGTSETTITNLSDLAKEVIETADRLEKKLL